MLIKKLTIENFRKIKKLDLDFSEGINVIIGNNEAGKSTVAEAILQVLFADPGSRSAVFKDRYQSWNNPSSPKLTLYFNSDVQQFSLQKDFGVRTVVMKDIASNKSSASFAAVSDAVTKVLGSPTRSVYEHTAFIKHSDIAKIESDRDLKAAIEKAAAASGDVSLNQVIFKLEQELKDMRVGLDRPAKNPGELKLLADKVADVSSQLNAARSKYELFLKAKQSGEESSSKLDETKKKIEDLSKLIENNKIARQAKEELKKVDAQIIEIEKSLLAIDKAEAEIKQLISSAAKFDNYRKLNWDETGRTLTELAETKKTLAQQFKQFEVNRVKPKQVKPGLHKVGIAILGGFVVTGVIFAIIGSNILYFIGAAAVGALVFAYLQLNQNPVLEPIGMNQLEQELTERYTRVSSALANSLHKLNVGSVDDFYAIKAEYVSLVEQTNQIQAQLKGMLGGRTAAAIKDEQLKLLARKKEITTNILTESVENSIVAPEEYLRKSRELELLQLDLKRLEEAATTAKVRVDDSEIDTEKIVHLEEVLEMATTDLEFKREREKVLTLTIDALKHALEETARSVESLIGNQIEKYLPKLTNNRYKDARFTDKFDVKVFSSEKNGWVDPVISLSSGAVDQIYFIIRLALINFLFKDKPTPIILDDPFVTFDKNRLELAKEILKDVSKKHQIFLFTHNPAYQDWGNAIVLS